MPRRTPLEVVEPRALPRLVLRLPPASSRAIDAAVSGARPHPPCGAGSKSPWANPCRYNSGRSRPTSSVRRLNSEAPRGYRNGWGQPRPRTTPPGVGREGGAGCLISRRPSQPGGGATGLGCFRGSVRWPVPFDGPNPAGDRRQVGGSGTSRWPSVDARRKPAGTVITAEGSARGGDDDSDQGERKDVAFRSPCPFSGRRYATAESRSYRTIQRYS